MERRGRFAEKIILYEYHAGIHIIAYGNKVSRRSWGSNWSLRGTERTAIKVNEIVPPPRCYMRAESRDRRDQYLCRAVENEHCTLQVVDRIRDLFSFFCNAGRGAVTTAAVTPKKHEPETPGFSPCLDNTILEWNSQGIPLDSVFDGCSRAVYLGNKK